MVQWKRGDNFERSPCSYLDGFTLFQHFFSNAIGTAFLLKSEPCFTGLELFAFGKDRVWEKRKARVLQKVPSAEIT